MASEEGANIPAIKVYRDKFSGHVVVVTGAAQGIGATTAQLFGEQGAQVILLDLQEQKLQQIQSLIERRGGTASYRVCDVTDWIISSFKKIDVLANLVAAYPAYPLVKFPTEEYHRILAVNLDASFFLTRAVLPHMQKAGCGRIIHASSSTFQEPEPSLTAYAAVIGLVRATAIEAGPGVTVNVVMPGLIKTETAWNAGVQPDGSHSLFDTVMKKQIVKRWGRPDDVAHTICFIASPEAQFITGQIFDYSGGETFH